MQSLSSLVHDESAITFRFQFFIFRRLLFVVYKLDLIELKDTRLLLCLNITLISKEIFGHLTLIHQKFGRFDFLKTFKWELFWWRGLLSSCCWGSWLNFIDFSLSIDINSQLIKFQQSFSTSRSLWFKIKQIICC